ncbi:putative ABC transport system permease protein [Saonia flava]|uniref:Putative ABC transport system permease protein n=1 Tax=Saonia flava TaxID=523696 RepID=A0A846QQ38_9FLAO|nr:ABC transporter permease [Saonia flava]NJB70218.1 putative ABC transport system permease protein [Saonia flava]
MYKLFLKIATRYLLKNKLYSFINIFGLAIGIASFVLIMIYIKNERSYDKFEGSENVYRAYMDYLVGDTFEAGDAMTYNASGPSLKQEFPEVLDYVRFYYFEKVTFVLGDNIFEQPMGSLADASYFNIFKYPLLKGTKETVLKDPNTVVLSETLARKLFGSEDPFQKTVSAFWDGTEVVLTVTGVMPDPPQNIHFKNNFLISFNTENTWGIFNEHQLKPNWNMNNYYTYIKTASNTNAAQLRQKIIDSDIEEDTEERHNIEPIEDIHLYSNKPYEVEANGSITRIKFLSAIAFIILILSWLNYINLSTTKSLERAKETGIRKVSGAQRPELMMQSLVESILLNMVAIVIALVLTLVLLPLYNNYTGKNLSLEWADIESFLPIFGFILFGMVLAGLYPAIVLSSYSPAKALKGKIKTSTGGLNVRKGLIVAQFLATIILLVGTIVVTKQINFLQNQPIGTNLNQIIALHGEVVSKEVDSLVISKYNVLESELENLSFVKNVAIAQTYPGDSFDNLSSSRGVTLPNGDVDNNNVFYSYHVRPDYFNLVGIEFLAGHTFIPTAAKNYNQVVVNEAFLRLHNITSVNEILGKNLKFWGNSDWQVTGIIKDYHHFGSKRAVLPMIIRNQYDVYNLLIKLDDTAISESGFTNSINQIEKKWNEIFPRSSFNYTFLDKKFQAQYNDDKAFGIAFQVFTLLAILIASLGLFGLTSYTVVQRKKEIGVRKVNGASVAGIMKLLNQDFVKWIALAFIIAVPISLYAMNKWLEGFAYKTNISWWVFALAGIVALAIALLTVSWQSFKAAMANPVESLKEE